MPDALARDLDFDEALRLYDSRPDVYVVAEYQLARRAAALRGVLYPDSDLQPQGRAPRSGTLDPWQALAAAWQTMD